MACAVCWARCRVVPHLRRVTRQNALRILSNGPGIGTRRSQVPGALTCDYLDGPNSRRRLRYITFLSDLTCDLTRDNSFDTLVLCMRGWAEGAPLSGGEPLCIRGVRRA